MDDLIAKPVIPDLLYTALDEWLSRHAGTAPDAGDTGELPAAAPPPAPLPPPTELSAAAQRDGERLLDRLRSMPGVDLVRGMASTRGKPERYLKLLQRFREVHAADGQRLVELLHGGEHDTAMRLAHTLKGSAGVLGFTDLSRVAGEIEADLKARKAAPAAAAAPADAAAATLAGERVATFCSSLAGICAVLPVADAEPQGSGAGPAATAAGSADLRTLAELVERHDTEALDILDSRRAALRAALGESFATIEAHLRGFRFDEALPALRAASAGPDNGQPPAPAADPR